MNAFVSKDKKDLKEELVHAPLYYIALCPMEARTVIFETILVVLEEFIKKEEAYSEDGEWFGYPSVYCTSKEENHESCEGDKIWKEKVYALKAGIEYILDEDGMHEFEPDYQKKVDDTLLLFAEIVMHLWI